MNLQIRAYAPQDFDAVTILWRIAREKALPDFQKAKGYFFYQDRDYFREHILAANQVWVASVDGQVLAFMAMRGDFIDQLYIHPDHWRQGIGRALLAHARRLSPERLRLFTLQVNLNARAFYEKNGFRVLRLGVSPAPESEPDVEYVWEGQEKSRNKEERKKE